MKAGALDHANIAHPKMQQRQQNCHGFLLVPRQHKRKRQVIYATPERIRQRACNLRAE